LYSVPSRDIAGRYGRLFWPDMFAPKVGAMNFLHRQKSGFDGNFATWLGGVPDTPEAAFTAHRWLVRYSPVQ